MRRIFSEVLRSGRVNIKAEYMSLHSLVFERYGFYSYVKSHFRDVWFADTAVSLEDFNLRNGFSFEAPPLNPQLDDLLSFCEYVYNFACALDSPDSYDADCCTEVAEHVVRLTDKLDYEIIDDDGIAILVAKNSNIQAAAEVAPGKLGFDLIKYDYRQYDGDLDGKRTILLQLISYLEPKRPQLEVLAKEMTNDLFFIANNFNLRHNNTDPQRSGKYKQTVAEMSDTELEGWYDLCRDMCATAILLLGYDEKREALGKVKNQS